MRKQELQSLTVGMWIVSKKDNSKHQITAVVEETGKIGLDGHKVYTFSTIQRWYDVAKAQNGGLEPEDIVTEDTTQVEDTEEQTNTSDLQDTDTQGNEIHEDTEQTGQQDVVEGNTATNNTGKTNTVQPTIQQSNLIVDINNLVDLHGANLIQRKEYIGVYKEGYRGCIAMIRRAKYGELHIDMKQKIWNALDEDYKKVVSKEHYTGIYDKSRKLFRIGYVNDLDILEVVICTALHIAS